jgi:3D (Asp-Asp-Asp) domain-containing protein
MGRVGYSSSRSGYFRTRVLDMRASAYTPGAHCNGKWAGRTATGVPPGYGVVAVDPRVIRLGSRLYIEGYGYAIAADTGGAIKGNRIDLGMQTLRQAFAFGRRPVRVHVLSSR